MSCTCHPTLPMWTTPPTGNLRCIYFEPSLPTNSGAQMQSGLYDRKAERQFGGGIRHIRCDVEGQERCILYSGASDLLQGELAVLYDCGESLSRVSYLYQNKTSSSFDAGLFCENSFVTSDKRTHILPKMTLPRRKFIHDVRLAQISISPSLSLIRLAT